MSEKPTNPNENSWLHRYERECYILRTNHPVLFPIFSISTVVAGFFGASYFRRRRLPVLGTVINLGTVSLALIVPYYRAFSQKFALDEALPVENDPNQKEWDEQRRKRSLDKK